MKEQNNEQRTTNNERTPIKEPNNEQLSTDTHQGAEQRTTEHGHPSRSRTTNNEQRTTTYFFGSSATSTKMSSLSRLNM